MKDFCRNKGIYIAPRFQEGIGMSFLEAMAMGRCVIAVNEPTMNEYIKPGKTGFLYNLDTVQDLTVGNIRSVQKRTLAFISKGYTKWNKKKNSILKWISIPAKAHIIVQDRTFFLFGKIPFFRWRR